jgi:hypothetical protein
MRTIYLAGRELGADAIKVGCHAVPVVVLLGGSTPVVPQPTAEIPVSE